MKKILALLLVAIFAMTAVACANNDVANNDQNDQVENESVENESQSETESDTESDTEAEAPANSVDLSGDLAAIIDAIYAEYQLPFGVGNIEIDINDPDALKMFTGLDSADKINSAIASEAMIMSQAYSMVLVRVNDAADAQAVAEEMKNGIDTHKWVCVWAEDLSVATYEDLVLLVMVDVEFDIPSDNIIDAFEKVCGGTLTSEL